MRIKILSLAALILLIVGCDREEPVVKDEPVASFEILSQNELTIELKNTSTNADTYSWKFGDGNTSTDQNPTHTYAKGGTYAIELTASSAESTSTKSLSVDVMDPYKKSGYFIGSVAGSSAGNTYYGGYYETLPSGDIDLTQQSTFQRLFFQTTHKGYLYGAPTDNEPGFGKFAINNSTGQLEEVASIPLFDRVSEVIILDDETGFFSQFNGFEITVFNPTTMEVTKTIDLSSKNYYPDHDRGGYNTIIYNEVTNKIYAVLYTDLAATPKFYDASEVYVEVIDVATQSWEKSIVHPDAEYPIFRGNTSAVIDDEGNTYLVCQGTYGLDGVLGPQAPKGSRPQIIRINTNSEFDTDYGFNPIDNLGFSNNFFQIFTTMVYGGNNKAYGLGTAAPDSQELLILLGKLAKGTITDAEYDQLLFLALYDETMKLMEVDLVTKNVQEVSGGPLLAGFGYPYMYNYGGKVFSAVVAEGGGFNGFYEIDPATNTAKEAFNVSAGGFAIQLIDLSAEN